MCFLQRCDVGTGTGRSHCSQGLRTCFMHVSKTHLCCVAGDAAIPNVSSGWWSIPKNCKALVSLRSLGGKWYFCAKYCVLITVQSWCAVLNCHLWLVTHVALIHQISIAKLLGKGGAKEGGELRCSLCKAGEQSSSCITKLFIWGRTITCFQLEVAPEFLDKLWTTGRQESSTLPP